MLIGFALFLRVEPAMRYANFLLPTMLGIGVGFALCFPAVNAQATTGVADHEQGLASGLVNTSIQIGGAVVLAVVTAVLDGAGHGDAGHGELLPGMHAAIAVVVGVAALGTVGAALRLRYLARSRRRRRARHGSSGDRSRWRRKRPDSPAAGGPPEPGDPPAAASAGYVGLAQPDAPGRCRGSVLETSRTKCRSPAFPRCDGAERPCSMGAGQ